MKNILKDLQIHPSFRANVILQKLKYFHNPNDVALRHSFDM